MGLSEDDHVRPQRDFNIPLGFFFSRLTVSKNEILSVIHELLVIAACPLKGSQRKGSAFHPQIVPRFLGFADRFLGG